MPLDRGRTVALLGGRARIEPQIRRTHGEELLARPTVVANRGLIDGEEAAGIRVFDPHRLRVVLEQHPIALFRRPQRIEHAHALGHLADQEQRRLVAVIVHAARAHLQHDFDAAGAPQDRLESPPAGDGRARDAGIRPERVRAGAQHALAGHAEQIGGARVGVEDHAAARIDDD